MARLYLRKQACCSLRWAQARRTVVVVMVMMVVMIVVDDRQTGSGESYEMWGTGEQVQPALLSCSLDEHARGNRARLNRHCLQGVGMPGAFREQPTGKQTNT